MQHSRSSLLLVGLLLAFCLESFSQGTLLLRTPNLHKNHIAFAYGSDIWVCDTDGQNVKRITSTQAVERDPKISPDGRTIAFTSNRSGISAVFTVSIEGGTPEQITWHPSGARLCDWSPDGKHLLYSSSRDAAPSNHNYLWTIPANGGAATKVSQQWGYAAEYAPDGNRLIVDRMRRWDVEWRMYRGGQNTALIILDPKTHAEILIPNEYTTDINPIWMENNVYFISDRDGVANIWKYNTNTAELSQQTRFKGSDVKSMSGFENEIIFERDGALHILDLSNNETSSLNINIIDDFPWAETKWQDISDRVSSVSLSPTGKRIVLEARGEVFTIPAKDGAPRNLTRSSAAADRRPLWSPKGDQIAWFSDMSGEGYSLYLKDQSGMKKSNKISIGTSKLGWEPSWSPDGKHIAFVDDDTNIRILDLDNKSIKTIDHAGNNLERGRMGITWSPDSKWLAYSKTGANSLGRIMVWQLGTKAPIQLTDDFADATNPAWDRDGKHFYFLASTDVALGSGWANTSSMQADPEYQPYIINLVGDDNSPFEPKSDEEEVKEEESDEKKGDKEDGDEDEKDEKKDEEKDEDDDSIKIDFDNIVRRTMPLPMDEGYYGTVIAGPEGSVFLGEYKPNSRGMTVHKFSIEDREAEEFVSGARQLSISHDGKKLLGNVGGQWKIMNASGGSGKGGESVNISLKIKLDRLAEWKQMFEEAWRYQRDYFYDKNMHGRDWDAVHKRYAPLLPHLRHRADLSYVLDQMNGELSVGHSFVFGGDYPKTERSKIGLLGADLMVESNRWKIKRIFTTESWNPGLSGPLDRPGMNIKEGHYLVGVNGVELSATDNPYQALDGTMGEQTIIHINDKPSFDGAWEETVEPIRSENGLRRRAWVEDNRRKVDQLSDGKLAYVWVPNTGGPGFVSFNRYFFAQQDKLGAVIDERFNGGGLLDDYMVDLMTRKLRASLTNEVPNGNPMRLPAGILGPKALLINEMAGSGGDFFPWVFRQQKAGKLIGATTWGGLVKSSVHYGLIDGGALTAPDNAVFDPNNNEWIAENEGVRPDIAVRQDALSLSKGGDPQLEKAVKELLKELKSQPSKKITPPPFSTPAIKK